MVEIVPDSEGDGGVGVEESPGQARYIGYVYAIFSWSSQMINLVMQFIIKLICEQPKAGS